MIHHKYSPSSLQAREASPCWEPTSGDSAASIAGTKQHDAFSTAFSPGDAVNKQIISAPKLDGLTDQQAEAVEKCFAYFQTLYLAARLKARKDMTEPRVIWNKYLPIDDDVIFEEWRQEEFKHTTAGYLDTAILSPDLKSADLIDLKFGLWPVEPAENNLQGISYLLGLVKEYPTLEEVTVHFCAPYLNEIDRHTFYKKDFPGLHLRIKLAVLRSIAWRNDYEQAKKYDELDQIEWFPTTSTCIFCSRLGRCGAAMSLAGRIGEKFHNYKLPDNLDPLMISEPGQWSAILKLADLMKLWAEAVRKEANAEALRSEVLPEGYRLVTSSQPSIKDAGAVLKLAAEMGVAESVRNDATSVTLGPLEEGIEAVTPRGQKSKKSKEFRDKLAETGAVVQGKPFSFLQMIRQKPTDD